MSLITLFRGLQATKCLTVPAAYTVQNCNYAAVKSISKKTAKKQKIVLPAETDPNKLVTHCCGANIYKDGEEIKLKPDSEYPDWLWDLRLKPKRLEEMDPDTKEYWRVLRKVAIQRYNRDKKINKMKRQLDKD